MSTGPFPSGTQDSESRESRANELVNIGGGTAEGDGGSKQEASEVAGSRKQSTQDPRTTSSKRASKAKERNKGEKSERRLASSSSLCQPSQLLLLDWRSFKLPWCATLL